MSSQKETFYHALLLQETGAFHFLSESHIIHTQAPASFAWRIVFTSSHSQYRKSPQVIFTLTGKWWDPKKAVKATQLLDQLNSETKYPKPQTVPGLCSTLCRGVVSHKRRKGDYTPHWESSLSPNQKLHRTRSDDKSSRLLSAFCKMISKESFIVLLPWAQRHICPLLFSALLFSLLSQSNITKTNIQKRPKINDPDRSLHSIRSTNSCVM